MKRKWLILLIVPIIGFIFNLTIPTNTVKAVPTIGSHYWWKPRKVITKKKQQIYLINGRTPVYRQHAVKKRMLRKGSIITVSTSGGSWPWIFHKRIPSIGKANYSHYFWVNNNHSSNWIVKYNRSNLKKFRK